MKTSMLESLVGRRFGRLTVLDLAVRWARGGTYRCRCDCGAITTAKRSHLIKGGRTSCGCQHAEYGRRLLVGKRFGRLTVQRDLWKPSRSKTRERHRHWCECRCDCGGTVMAESDSLVQLKRQSCGCLRREQVETTLMNRVWSQHLNNAKSRGYEQCLTRAQYFELAGSPCHYCGRVGVAVAQQRSRRGEVYGEFRYNGVDRFDNERGYTVENSVPCCKHCNVAKRTMSVDEFLVWVESVYRHSCLKRTVA